jgi:CHAT domain-containing protein
MVPLLALLLLGATAAASTIEDAARNARTALDRSDFNEAERIIKDALRRAGTRNDETVWSLRVMHAEALYLSGDQAAARNELRQEPPRELRTSEPAVRRLLVLGKAAIRLRENEEAARVLEEARRIAAVHQPHLLVEIYPSMVTPAPDLAHAESNASLAIDTARAAGKPRFEARALSGLLYRYKLAERYEDAARTGEKALTLAQSLKDNLSIQQVAGNLGWNYIELGDYERAAELFAIAEQKAGELGMTDDRVRWLNQLGNLCVQKHDSGCAERYYLQALALAPPKHSDVGFILSNLAFVAIETGHFEAARNYNSRALKAKTDLDSQRRSQIIGARIDAAAKDYERAIRTLALVIQQTDNLATRWEARGRLAQVYASIDRVDDADHEFRAAIETVREARSKVPVELRVSFFNLTADIFNEYVDFLMRHQRIARALEATEIIRVGALDDAFERPTSLKIGDPRAAAIQQNATILSYWLGPQHSYVWTITSKDVRAARIVPDADIKKAVDGYQGALKGPYGTLQLSGGRGRRLFAMLIPSVPRTVARGGRIIVIPDSALHALNFETLVVPASRQHYWIEDVVITEASSIGVLRRHHPPPTRPPSMLLVGNVPSPDSSFRPLRNAGAEMTAISRRFAAPVRKLEGAAATPASYHNATPEQFDFVHFVAHGVAFRTRPLESAVILARDRDTNNYKLLAREIITQPLSARLVTISSCHGAGTRAYTGEGLVGLAWAFLRAGASNVIAALWEVDDSATPQLMDRFYEKAAAGGDLASALRDAKLSLVRSGGIYRYPRYWAPFVFYSG